MSQFFDRKVRVEVGKAGQEGWSWDSLRVSFRVQKSSDREPDTAEVQIYNLSSTSRSALEGKGLTLRLFGGYLMPALLFTGDLQKVEHESASPDIATRLEAQDGGVAWSMRMQETFRGPVEAGVLLQRVADAMRLPVAYLEPTLARVQFQTAYVASGPVRRVMDDICSTIGGSWKVQDGAIVVTAQGQPFTQTGPLIAPNSGLIGRAEKTDEGVKVTSLLQPGIVPGGVFRVESEGAEGWFRATHVTHLGDSGWDTAFYTEIEGKEIAR